MLKMLKSMDGWMTKDFTSFLTIFLHSYQDDVRVIMEGCEL